MREAILRSPSVEDLFDALLTSLWAPATYLKLLFLAVTAPFWWPLAKVMYKEILPALNAAENANTRRAPGEDPFLSIPLATHRAQAAQRVRPSSGPRGRAR
jgi:hypothetical protein